MMEKRLRNVVAAIRGYKIPELPNEILILEKEINSKFGSTAPVTEIIAMNTTVTG